MTTNHQLEFNLQPSLRHPYQVLEQTFELEELLSNEHPERFDNVTKVEVKRIATRELTAISPQVSANPYSRISQEEVEVVGGNVAERKISVAGYIKFTTKVLKQYSPSVGKRRTLRAEFQEYIDDRHTQNPENRIRVVQFLERYDLESAGFAPPLFNRELSDRLLGKLRKITEK